MANISGKTTDFTAAVDAAHAAADQMRHAAEFHRLVREVADGQPNKAKEAGFGQYGHELLEAIETARQGL